MALQLSVLKQKLSTSSSPPYPASYSEAASKWADALILYWGTGQVLGDPVLSNSSVKSVISNKIEAVFRSFPPSEVAAQQIALAISQSMSLLTVVGATFNTFITTQPPPPPQLAQVLRQVYSQKYLSVSASVDALARRIEEYTKQTMCSGLNASLSPVSGLII